MTKPIPVTTQLGPKARSGAPGGGAAVAVGFVFLALVGFGLLGADMCSAQSAEPAPADVSIADTPDGAVSDSPGTEKTAASEARLDDDLGTGSAGASTVPLTRHEEWRLGIEIRRSNDWDIQDLERREVMERMLGRDRLRRLEGARFQFQLRDADPLYGHDWRELSGGMDEAEDVVLSAYTKLARETLEDVLGLDELEDRLEKRTDRWLGRDGRRTERGQKGRSSAVESSYKLRISPRFSQDYVGVKFRMPYSQVSFLDHLSFRVRYDFEEDRTLYMLKFDSHERFFHLTYEPDHEEHGDELSLSLRLFW